MDKDRMELICPHCGPQILPAEDFDHMIVVDREHALTSYRCPSCSEPLTTFMNIPPSLAPYVDERLSSLSDIYPKANFERFCSDKNLRQEDEYIKRFKEELEGVFGVDDMLSKADSSKRDERDK